MASAETTGQEQREPAQLQRATSARATTGTRTEHRTPRSQYAFQLRRADHRLPDHLRAGSPITGEAESPEVLVLPSLVPDRPTSSRARANFRATPSTPSTASILKSRPPASPKKATSRSRGQFSIEVPACRAPQARPAADRRLRDTRKARSPTTKKANSKPSKPKSKSRTKPVKNIEVEGSEPKYETKTAITAPISLGHTNALPEGEEEEDTSPQLASLRKARRAPLVNGQSSGAPGVSPQARRIRRPSARTRLHLGVERVEPVERAGLGALEKPSAPSSVPAMVVKKEAVLEREAPLERRASAARGERSRVATAPCARAGGRASVGFDVRAVAEFAGATDVVEQRRANKQVTVESWMHRTEVHGERRDGDGVLDQASEVGVVTGRRPSCLARGRARCTKHLGAELAVGEQRSQAAHAGRGRRPLPRGAQ